MRKVHRRAMFIAGMALGLGAIAGPARAHDGYYLEDGCRPVRVYEPIRVYEPDRVYTVDPYCDVPGYRVYSYSPGYDPYYDGYYRRERGFSFDISIHFGSRHRYRGSYGRYGYRYRSRRYCD